MDKEKHKERVLSRFDKIIRYFWDGLPTPLFVGSTHDPPRSSFDIRLLGYSPDYHGETREIVLEPVVNQATKFRPLSNLTSVSASLSSRIGSHYSPFVGFFTFKRTPFLQEKHSSLQRIRIPVEQCEDDSETSEDFLNYGKQIRTQKLTELYEPLVREYSPLNRSSMRNIIVLSSKSLSLNSRVLVLQEANCVSDEYVHRMSEAIFNYLCINPIVRSILAPLQLKVFPDTYLGQIQHYSSDEKAAYSLYASSGKKNLMDSLRWGNKTSGFFTALNHLWITHCEGLTLFNLELTQGNVDALKFLDQLICSMRTGFTRLRIDFFSIIEEIFFEHIFNAKEALLLSEVELKNSTLQRVFTAANIFLTIRLRDLIIRELKKLLKFFQLPEGRRIKIFKRIALRKHHINLEIIVGNNGRPYSPTFSGFCVGLSDLFSELQEQASTLPSMEEAVLRTLDIKTRHKSVLTSLEYGCFRFFLVSILDQVGQIIDKISFKYSQCTVFPLRELLDTKENVFDDVRGVVSFARNHMYEIFSVSADVVYCSCFALCYSGVKEHFFSSWESCVSRYYHNLNMFLFELVERTNERCFRTQEALNCVPYSVPELRAFLKHIEEAKTLVETVVNVECARVIKLVSCMEENRVSVEAQVYASALKLMKWPQFLTEQLALSEQMVAKSKLSLAKKLCKVRAETREKMRTFSTGITELYNMFNFEICDIAAQTCVELQVLVNQISDTVQTILSEEDLLGVPSVDQFEDLHPLIHYFEVISQYWFAVNNSTRLRDFFNCPIESINAGQMIDDVREWRRLIHASRRHLRGFESLVRLGRQQEFVLAKFEALEEFLYIITIPGLRKVHWKEITRLLGAKLKDDPSQALTTSVSLQRLLDGGVMDHLGELTQIVLRAKNDFSAEAVVEEMKSLAKRIPFQFIEISEYSMQRLVVKEECRRSMLSQVEDFILRCRMMNERMGLSAPVLNMLQEWKGAVGKVQCTLLEWGDVEEQWSILCNFLFLLQEKKKGGDVDDSQEKILDKLTQANEALVVLSDLIRKSQFSLYTAIVQDTISDHVATAKAAMSTATRLISEGFEAMREVFPRFRFLTDQQMGLFLSPYNIRNLYALLPFMYARLCYAKVESDSVISFSTCNGATISADDKLRLTNESAEVWMGRFDQTLKSSVASAIRTCYTEFYQADLQTWLLRWCSQFTHLSLRAMFTSDLRDVIRCRGATGLRAYRTKLKDMVNEIKRIASSSDFKSEEWQRVVASLTYLRHAESEIDHFFKAGIASLSDIDYTPMLQTHIAESGITVRTMGMTYSYGLEFFGNEREVFLTPGVVEKGLCFLGLGGRSTPLFFHCEESLYAIQSLCYVLGLFMLILRCSETTALDNLRSYLRGAMQIGIYVCVQECNRLSVEFQNLLAQCFNKAQEGFLSSKGNHYSVEVPLGSGAASINVKVHRNFFLSATTSIPLHEVSQEIFQEYRPACFPSLQPAAVVRLYLSSCGMVDVGQEASSTFGVMYEQFCAVWPMMFTYRKLVAVLRCVAKKTLAPVKDLPVLLFEAFIYIFSSVLEQHRNLKVLLEWHAKHTFRFSKSYTLSVLAASAEKRKKSMSAYFADILSLSTRVMVVGPHFAGKHKLCSDVVKGFEHVVLCLSLITAQELYSHGILEKILGTLATVALNPLKPHFVIFEDDDFSHMASWMDSPLYGRSLGRDNTSFMVSPSTRIIVCANTLRFTTPRAVSEFVIFALSAPSAWRPFLRNCLSGAPEVSVQVMEIVLPAIWRVVQGGGYAEISEDALDNDAGLYAACQRCANLYKRWYAYVANPCSCFVTHGHAEENEAGLDEKVLAAQCVIQAVCWGLGLVLDSSQHFRIMAALREIEKSVNSIMESYEIMEKVIPPLGEREFIMDMVVSRNGWKPFHEAMLNDISLSWSDHTYINPNATVLSQRIPLPSQLPSLHVIECLLNCGQHVLIRGLHGSQKSSILQSTRLCDRWVSHFVTCSKDFSPNILQERIAAQLLPRGSKKYGPLLGYKLIVCVDDMHLSISAEGDVPLAGRLLSFCEKYSALSTPSIGFLPTEDVVFFASTSCAQDRPDILRSCVEVCLPCVEGSELANGIWKLLEASCFKKRTDSFSRACTSFITLAHSAFERIAMLTNMPCHSVGGSHCQSPILSTMPLKSLSAPLEGGDALLQSATITEAEKYLSKHFHLALYAVEITRQQLLSTISDVQAATNLFWGINKLYTGQLSLSTERVGYLQQEIAQSVAATLGQCLCDTKFTASTHSSDRFDFFNSTKIHARVAEWITEFEANSHMATILLLSDIHILLPEAATQGKPDRTSSEAYAYHSQSSVLEVYPNSLQMANISHNSLAGSSVLRAFGNPLPRFRSSVFRKSRSTSFVSATQKSFAVTSAICTSSFLPFARPRLTQTTWISRHAFALAQAVRQTNPSLHLILIGKPSFGIYFLLRLVCSVTRFPLAILKPPKECSYAGEGVVHGFNSFAKDMKRLIAYAYASNVHVVVFVPYVILSIPCVMRQIDLIIRLGELNELFTPEELWTLINGTPHTSTLMQGRSRRSTQTVSPEEELVLNNYIRHCFTFILQVDDEKELHASIGSKGYSGLSCMPTIHLHYPNEDRIIRRELVSSCLMSLDDDKISSFSSQNPESHDRMVSLVCALYETVQQTHPGTHEEQLIEFVYIIKQLEPMCVSSAASNATAATVLSGRGDAVMELIKQDAQRAAQATADIAAIREEIASLVKVLAREEKELWEYKRHARAAQRDCQKGEEKLLQLEAARAEIHADICKTLQMAATRLKQVKSVMVRALNPLWLPPRADLLVRAVYHILGEEIPKTGNRVNELLSIGVKRMCVAGFAESLTARSIEDVTDLSPLFSAEHDLIEFRHKASGYAQLICDYVLTFINSARNCQKVADEEGSRLNTQIEWNNQAQENFARLSECAAVALDRVRATQTAKINLEKRYDETQGTQKRLAEREKLLFRYLNNVDRFSRFILPSEHVEKELQRVSCAKGDALLLAAYYSLLSMHPDYEALCGKLQEVLSAHGVPFSPSFEEVVKPLLFHRHVNAIDEFAYPAFPFRHRCALYTFHLPLMGRWPFLGGVCVVFHSVLEEYLRFTCTACNVVSTLDPNIQNHLLQAMKDGEGIILHDVEIDPGATDIILSLAPLVKKLSRVHQKNCSGSYLNSNESSMGQNETIQFHLFGQDVNVHPRFFLLCVSSSWITIPSKRVACCDTIYEHLNVTNLFEPIPLNARIEHYVIRTSGFSKIPWEDYQKRKQSIFDESAAFMETHDKVSKLLCQDLDDIAENGGRKLDVLDTLVADVDAHDRQVVTLGVRNQSAFKQLREGWFPIETAVQRGAQLLRFVEVEKLGRTWDDSLLDPFLRCITIFSPELAAHLAPLHFSDLTTEQKHFYTVFNFADSVVSCFSCGWPLPLRGLFAEFILCGTFLAWKGFSSYLESTFSEIQFLNAAQFDVLCTLLGMKEEPPIASLWAFFNSSGGWVDEDAKKAVTKKIIGAISRLYRASGDDLLLHLVDSPCESFVRGCYSFKSTSDMLIFEIFQALLALNLPHCEGAALRLYSNSIDSIRNYSIKTGTNPSFLNKEQQQHRSFNEANNSDSSGNLFTSPTQSVNATYLVHHSGYNFLPLINIHSRVQLLDRCASHYYPLWVVTYNPYATLLSFRRDALDQHCKYDQYELTCHTESTYSLSRHLVQSLLNQSMLNYGKRHWICVLIKGISSQHANSPGVSSDENTESYIKIVENLNCLLSTYADRRSLGIDNSGSSTKFYVKGAAVQLVVVCTPKVHHILWKKAPYSFLKRSFYICDDYTTPRRHLLHLLEGDCVQRLLTMGFNTIASGTALTLKAAPSRSARFGEMHEPDKTPTVLTETTEVKNKASLNWIDRNSSVSFNDARASIWSLLVKELCILHITFSERRRLILEQKRARCQRLYGVVDGIVDLLYSDDANTCYDHVLNIIVQNLNFAMSNEFFQSGLNTECGGECGKSCVVYPSDITATTINFSNGRRAYYHYRNQRSAWQQLRQKIRSFPSGVSEVLNPHHKQETNARDVRGKRQMAIHPPSTMIAIPDTTKGKSRASIDFAWIRSIAFQIFWIRAGYAFEDIIVNDLEVLKLLLQLVVAPPSIESTSLSNIEVSNNWSWMTSPFPLVLDGSSDVKNMIGDVRERCSELLELSGDAETVAAYHARLFERIGQIIFSNASSRHYVDPNTQLGSKGRTVREATPCTLSEALHLSPPPNEIFVANALPFVFEYENLEGYYKRLLNTHAVSLQWRDKAIERVSSTAACLFKVIKIVDAPALCAPESSLMLWLPALQYPLTTLWCVCESLQFATTNCLRPIDYSQIPTLMLIVTQRRFLTPWDVVLEGASVAPGVAQEIYDITGWSCLSPHSPKPPLRPRCNAVGLPSANCDMDLGDEEGGNEVVVAARTVRLSKDSTDTDIMHLHIFECERGGAVPRPTGKSPSETRDAVQLSTPLATSPATSRVVTVEMFPNRLSDFCWNPTLNPSSFSSSLKLFGSGASADKTEGCSETDSERRGDSVFVTQCPNEGTDTPPPFPSVRGSTLCYKASRMLIPLFQSEVDVFLLSNECDLGEPKYRFLADVQLCIIFERSPCRSVSFGNLNEMGYQKTPNRTLGARCENNQNAFSFSNTLQRYILIE